VHNAPSTAICNARRTEGSYKQLELAFRFNGLRSKICLVSILQMFWLILTQSFPEPRRISASSHQLPARKHKTMLSWSLTFLILAIIAGILGFGGIAGAAAGIAKILFIVFLVLLIVSAISRSMRGGTP
jgi:uncharacterized membrane protein YtjA (UPF0391 family)